MQIRSSYIICATPRTGSNLLCEALTNTGLAGCPTELSSLADIPYWPTKWENTSSLENVLGKVIKGGTTPNGVFGLKLMWSGLNLFVRHFSQLPGYEGYSPENLLGALFHHPRYIWITRRDKI